MVKLGRVIALSGDTLTRLDVSDNDIHVATKAQREDWCTFLESFQGCYMLKRIDFGGNSLGSAGFDVLARVFTKSDLDFMLDDCGNGLSKVDHEDRKNDIAKAMKGVQLGGEASGMHEAANEDMQQYASTRGLRSVPYLVFSNTCTTNAGAFHLWNMIMQHRSPAQLLEFLPPGKSMAPLEGAHDSCGIIYSPNEQLGQLGRRLLELGAKYRELMSHQGTHVESSESNYEDDDDEELIKKREADRAAQVEMGRVKNRLLLDVIKTEGMHSVDLWSVAFKMMVISRAILLENKDEPKPVENSSNESPICSLVEEKDSKPTAASAFTDFVEEFPIPSIRSRIPHPASRFWTEEDFPSLSSSLHRTESKNPQTSVPKQQKGRSNREPSQPVTAATPDGTTGARAMSGNALAKITASAAHLEAKRFGLPMELWRKIIAEAIAGSEILSEEQQMEVLKYASEWVSIKQELRIKGGTEFEQQWKILASMDCLSYKK
ncbi:hypothetical protein VTO42DRAFT_7454 [Malbranchea cinnamomea]